MEKANIKNLSLQELEGKLLGLGEKKFHAQQIFSWVYKKGVEDFNKMSNLSASLRSLLADNFTLTSPEVIKKEKSSDGTEKFLFRLFDQNTIEAVSIPTDERVTGCISSQAGCKFKCYFCASGITGFKRNLEVSEIISQILFLRYKSSVARLTHLVFMGTGEPLDNYDNVLKAIRIINSADTLNIGARRITISTSGIIPGIQRLSSEGLQVELSISLHAADDKTRSALMPVNKIYPLKNLLNCCQEYIKKTNRQITFEYILIKNINSDLPSSKNLVRILKGLNCKVNLIPANPVQELNIFPPEKEEINQFMKYLTGQGIVCTLRRERGKDIQAACGQLRLRHEKS